MRKQFNLFIVILFVAIYYVLINWCKLYAYFFSVNKNVEKFIN